MEVSVIAGGRVTRDEGRKGRARKKKTTEADEKEQSATLERWMEQTSEPYALTSKISMQEQGNGAMRAGWQVHGRLVSRAPLSQSAGDFFPLLRLKIMS